MRSDVFAKPDVHENQELYPNRGCNIQELPRRPQGCPLPSFLDVRGNIKKTKTLENGDGELRFMQDLTRQTTCLLTL